MKLLFFDTETTSVKPGHICQLSYITVDTTTKPQRTIGKNFFFTVDEIKRQIDLAAQYKINRVHLHLSDELLERNNRPLS